MLNHEADIEDQGPGPRDEQRLAQPDPAHKLGGDPEGEDEQADELKQPADAVTPGGSPGSLARLPMGR